MEPDDKKFIGTHLTEDEYRNFSVRAAQQGKSRSGLLRELAMQAIAAAPAEQEREPETANA